MGFVKNVKADSIGTEAKKAYDAGRNVFTPVLNTPGSHHGMSGDIDTWSLMIEAIENAGWAMYHWTVGIDDKGRPQAYPLFRRRA